MEKNKKNWQKEMLKDIREQEKCEAPKPQEKEWDWEKMPNWMKTEGRFDKFYKEKGLKFPEWMYQQLVGYIYMQIADARKEGLNTHNKYCISCKFGEVKASLIRQAERSKVIKEVEEWIGFDEKNEFGLKPDIIGMKKSGWQKFIARLKVAKINN